MVRRRPQWASMLERRAGAIPLPHRCDGGGPGRQPCMTRNAPLRSSWSSHRIGLAAAGRSPALMEFFLREYRAVQSVRHGCDPYAGAIGTNGLALGCQGSSLIEFPQQRPCGVWLYHDWASSLVQSTEATPRRTAWAGNPDPGMSKGKGKLAPEVLQQFVLLLQDKHPFLLFVFTLSRCKTATVCR